MPRSTARPPIRSAPRHKLKLPARNAPGDPTESKLTLASCEKAYHITRVGGTLQDVAIALKTRVSRLSVYMNRFPEFRAAIEGGRAARDDQIVSALFHRAKGYEHEAEKIFCTNGVVQKVTYTEHYPPDAASAIFWLKNRQPDEWKDVSQKEITGADGGPIEIQHLVVKAEELGQKIRGMTFDAEVIEEKPA
jgi:hypothetical protein